MPFFVGFMQWFTENKWQKLLVILTQLTGFVDAFGLIMIGVFSENFLPQHMFWSSFFFGTNIFVLLFASIALWTNPNFYKGIAIYGIAIAAVNFVFAILLSNSPLLEWVTVFTALGFAGLIVINAILKFRVK